MTISGLAKRDYMGKVKNYDNNRKTIDMIVCHHNGGFGVDITGTLNKNGTSAHYQIDTNGNIYGLLDEEYVAYQAGNYPVNQRSIGIECQDVPNLPENVGKPYDQLHWVISDKAFEAYAKLIADICKRRGIPVDRAHIKAHKEVGSTNCPANSFDIDKLVARAKQIAGGTTSTAPAQPSKPSQPAKPTIPQIAVDRSAGPAFWSRAQQLAGTPQDGYITGQYKGNSKYYVTGVVLNIKYGSGGSKFVRVLQKKLKERGYYNGAIDGYLGQGTIKAWQRALKESAKLYSGQIDGYMGPLMVEAIQKAFNKGWLF
jgi:hypothetical protein